MMVLKPILKDPVWSGGHLKWLWQLLRELGTHCRRWVDPLLKSWPTVLAPVVCTFCGNDLALRSTSHFSRRTEFVSMAEWQAIKWIWQKDEWSVLEAKVWFLVGCDSVVTSNYMNKLYMQSNCAWSEWNCNCTKGIVLSKSCIATKCYRQYVKLLDFHEYYCVIIVSIPAQFDYNSSYKVHSVLK